jgi:hypothetical protein
MQATTGMEPHFDSLDDTSLKDMTLKVGDSFKTWNSGTLPALPSDPAPVPPATSEAPVVTNTVVATNK